MPRYISLVNFTEQGLKNVADTVDRAAKAKEVMAGLGVKMVDIHWCLGQYDIVVTVDAPDDAAAVRALLTVAKAGNIRSTTMRAFDAGEMAKIVKGL